VFVERNRSLTGAVIERAASVEEATSDADIVCTVTSAAEPILEGWMVKTGTHLNLVGSSVPDCAEVDTDLVAKSRLFVDSREGALAQAGEFLRAKRDGAVTDSHIVGEIGQVFAGELGGRLNRDEITIYKSLGVIAQDLAAATAIWRSAEAQNLGQVVIV
jgi:ornithine cyclodeaminase